MTTRESLPNAAALEQIEAPSREVAEAKRRAAESEASDKPALKDAVETLARLDDPRVAGMPRTPTILGVGDPEQRGERGAKRDARDTNKLPAGPRGELHTSPSLARVLAGDDQRDADTLVEEPGDAIPEEIAEPSEEARQPAPLLPRFRPAVLVGVVVLAVVSILGMLAIALWGGPDAPVPAPGGQKAVPSATTGAPTATQTVPVTAIATATVEPPATSAAVTADPVHSAGTARSSSKASAKTASAADTSSKATPPTTSSAKPQKSNWVPEDS